MIGWWSTRGLLKTSDGRAPQETLTVTLMLVASSGADSYFDGLIGPVRFWKRVLTSDERTGCTTRCRSDLCIAGGGAVRGSVTTGCCSRL